MTFSAFSLSRNLNIVMAGVEEEELEQEIRSFLWRGRVEEALIRLEIPVRILEERGASEGEIKKLLDFRGYIDPSLRPPQWSQLQRGSVLASLRRKS